jgi:hypothetical protein
MLPMHPFVIVTTAFLLVIFLLFCFATWRIYQGRTERRPFIERAAMALVFAPVAWQAFSYLRLNQQGVTPARTIGVWVQLVSAAGIAALMIAQGWIRRGRMTR